MGEDEGFYALHARNPEQVKGNEMASRPPGAPTLAQLNLAARQHGFPDYASYSAWQAKYRQGGSQAAAPAPNFLQTLLAKIPIHPTYLISRVSKAYGDATGAQP